MCLYLSSVFVFVVVFALVCILIVVFIPICVLMFGFMFVFIQMFIFVFLYFACLFTPIHLHSKINSHFYLYLCVYLFICLSIRFIRVSILILNTTLMPAAGAIHTYNYAEDVKR